MGSSLGFTTMLKTSTKTIETSQIIEQGIRVQKVFSPAVKQMRWVSNSKMRKTTFRIYRKTLLKRKTS